MRSASRLLVVSFLLGTASIHAADPPPLGPTDGADLSAEALDRVAVGEPAPDFVLEDHEGESVRLSGFRGERSVVLVFYRGHW